MVCGLDTNAVLLPLGDIFVSCNPATTRHRVLLDADDAAIRQFIDSGRIFLDHSLEEDFNVGVGGQIDTADFCNPALDPMTNDVTARRPVRAQFGRNSVDLGISFVAQDQPVLCIEHRQPVRHVLQSNVEAQVLLSKIVFGALALNDFADECVGC